MPVILPRDLETDWLDPEVSKEHALSLLEPYPADAMVALQASTLVNSVWNEGRSTRGRSSRGRIAQADGVPRAGVCVWPERSGSSSGRS